MRRTKEEAEQTRRDIFEAGVRVFSEKGYAASTLSDIARAAGITRGAIYWHYKSKGEFFEEILGRVSSYYDEIVGQALGSDKPFLDTLHCVVIKLLHRFAEDSLWRAMQELVIRSALNRDGTTPWIGKSRVDRRLDVFARAITAEKIHGNWDASTAVTCLSSVLLGIFLQMLSHNMELSDTRIKQIADFVVRGFAPTDT